MTFAIGNEPCVDPYRNFKFHVKCSGLSFAGFSTVSALKRSREIIEHREGGDPPTSHQAPGRSQFEPITLERGVTHDREIEQWANKVWNCGSGLGGETSLNDFHKDLIDELYNQAGPLVIAYKVCRCWVSTYQVSPELEANANAVAIQSIKLENEGWEYNRELTEPAEPRGARAGFAHGSLGPSATASPGCLGRSGTRQATRTASPPSPRIAAMVLGPEGAPPASSHKSPTRSAGCSPPAPATAPCNLTSAAASTDRRSLQDTTKTRLKTSISPSSVPARTSRYGW